MMTPSDDDRERRALDALSAAALRGLGAADDLDDLDVRDEACLSAEERSAVDRRGPEILKAVLAGSWQPRPPIMQAPPMQVAETVELAGAFNRAQGDGEVTSAAREEMDAKRRELDEEDQRKRDR